MNNKNKLIGFIEFIKNNPTTVFTSIFFIIFIIIFTIFAYTRIQNAKNIASDKISVATQYIAMGTPEKGLSLLDDVIVHNSKTSSAYIAMLVKANYLFSQKDYTKAKELLEIVINKAKPEAIKPLAYPTLIALYEESNDDEQAIAISQQFLKTYKDNFLVPSVMENLANLYMKANNIEEANKIHNDIIDLFPDSVYATRAKGQIK